ncbi:hypothetical protein C8Q77DRAFT_1254076 [Trametes polyzona]|nr:hypothetical protein C8Q77DRAFT_1254076 [Trametes polyzona]
MDSRDDSLGDVPGYECFRIPPSTPPRPESPRCEDQPEAASSLAVEEGSVPPTVRLQVLLHISASTSRPTAGSTDPVVQEPELHEDELDAYINGDIFVELPDLRCLVVGSDKESRTGAHAGRRDALRDVHTSSTIFNPPAREGTYLNDPTIEDDILPVGPLEHDVPETSGSAPTTASTYVTAQQPFGDGLLASPLPRYESALNYSFNNTLVESEGRAKHSSGISGPSGGETPPHATQEEEQGSGIAGDIEDRRVPYADKASMGTLTAVPASPQAAHKCSMLRRGKKRAREADSLENEERGGPTAGPSAATSFGALITTRQGRQKRSKTAHTSQNVTEADAPLAGPSNDAQLRCRLHGGQCQYAVTHNIKTDTDHLNGHKEVNAHGRYLCTYPECTVNGGLDDGGYRVKCDRNRHVMSLHWRKRHTCPHAGCGKTYAREHTLKQHMTAKHGRPKRVRRG